MGLKKSSAVTGACALFYSGWVSAVGLGAITLHSTLDEPFDAEIALINIGDADETQILVDMASKADFDKSGIPWELHLSNLSFKVDLSNPGKPVIRVTSQKPIKEPFLDFVTELQWPDGRLLREYTIFLDLPAFEGGERVVKVEAPAELEKPSPVVAEKPSDEIVEKPVRKRVASTTDEKDTFVQDTATQEKAEKVEKAQEKAEKVVTTPARNTPSRKKSVNYEVRRGDTLWEIAAGQNYGAATIQQKMLAIHASNRSAFVGNDANLIKLGAVLQMPTQADIDAIDVQEANRLAKAQAEAWQGRQNNKISVPDDVKEARTLIGDVDATPVNKPAKEQNGRLRLSVPTDSELSAGQGLPGSGLDSADGSGTEALLDQLDIAHEELDRSKRENLELRAKLASLEDQLDTLSKLVELESNDMRAIQLGTKIQDARLKEMGESEQGDAPLQNEEALQGDGSEVPSSEGGLDKNVEDQAEADSALADSTSADGTVVNSTLEEAAPVEKASWLSANWLSLSGIIAVIVGIFALLARGRRDEQSDSYQPLPSINLGERDAAESDDSPADADSEDEPFEPELSSSGTDSSEVADDVAAEEDVPAEAPPKEISDLAFELDSEEDFEFDLTADDNSTQLDLAKAYIEMGDEAGAREIIKDVLANGSDVQKAQANDLLEKLS